MWRCAAAPRSWRRVPTYRTGEPNANETGDQCDVVLERVGQEIPNRTRITVTEILGV